MIRDSIKKFLNDKSSNDNVLKEIVIYDNISIQIYPKSIKEFENDIYFIGLEGKEKFLFVVSEKKDGNLDRFSGDFVSEDSIKIKKCTLSDENAKEIQNKFEFTKPILLGKENSFGFGDRLGLANPAHIRSLESSEFKPIIAQQSIRELIRTNRKPAEVMAAAVWAVFQEGYTKGFGSDADHLKTTEDIDLMISNGFTMFTFDPSDHVVNEADTYDFIELYGLVEKIPWDTLKDSPKSLIDRYEEINLDLGDEFIIAPTRDEILRAIVKYGAAVAHIYKMYLHMANNYTDFPHEIEISVDETDSVTTPFEHFFFASELSRLGVKWISLAPRFIGSFEKGIDYVGDLDVFKAEYLKHVKIAEHFGSYKISLHSGSDKFDIYAAIGSLKQGYTHVKTAGTSYLEAVKVIATKNQSLFREILDFCRDHYAKEKETYHVSGDVNKVKSGWEYCEEELLELFKSNDARQVLHVTFGKVLTEKIEDGTYRFKDDFIKCLHENEELHYKYLYDHFRNHLKPFEVN